MREFSMKDKIGYTLGDLGCCCTEQFRAMFLTVFYTLVLKVNPLHVGTILLITKIWDAINDPIIGALIDARKSTKGGRFYSMDQGIFHSYGHYVRDWIPGCEQL